MVSFDRFWDVPRKISCFFITELKKVGSHPVLNICNTLKLYHERCFIIMMKSKIYLGIIWVEMIGWSCQVEIHNPQRIWVLIRNPEAHYISVHVLYFYGHQWEQIVLCSESTSRRHSTGKLDHLCQICVLDGFGG